jgi:serine/threonine protein kinase
MPEPSDAPGDATQTPRPAAPATVDLPARPEAPDEPTLTPTDASTPSVLRAGVADLESGRQARSFGDYELLGEIARGGMGVVYRAREKQSGRLVALKMMLADSALDAVYVQRFILEARATGELSHPGIVAIHSWGQHEGQLFYTMDYVPGFPLSRILKRRPLPVPRAVRYLLGIARAVAAAHVQGIVHRDLKPSNVVIDPTDQPRVLDFGLAKRHRSTPVNQEETAIEVGAVDDVVDVLPVEAAPAFPSSPTGRSPSTPHATEKGTVLGTPAYMAPEQARGEHGSVGPAADVHALGAIFFELLTGRPPFEGATMMDTLIEVLEKKPPSVRLLNRSVPASIATVCERCLAKKAEDRYANAGALADDLERCWLRATQRRRFARLAVVSGLIFGVVLGVRLTLLNGDWLHLDTWSNFAHERTAFAGPMMQGTASVLATLANALLSLVPFLCLLAFAVWLGAWLWHTGGWALRRHHDLEATETGSEPYLQRLFAMRGETDASAPAQAGTRRVIELSDVEFAKAVHQSSGCVVRKGRQKSLDRPVLAWLDPGPAAAGEPAPGVMVRHPSVLSLHAVGSSAEGRYVVTEPAAATPLADLLERRGLEPLEAVFLVIKVAYALQAFHDQGVCHGRLSADWILARSDLEPLLCPCGVPSQAAGNRQADVNRLGRLLGDWLPPRPRGWRRQALAMLYRVCDAAVAGEYARPADLAADLERAVKIARVRWWERLAGSLIVTLWVLPLLACMIGLIVRRFTPESEPSEGTRFMMEHWFLLQAPSIILLGLLHAWGLVQRYRLRLQFVAARRLFRRRLLRDLLQGLVFTALPALGAWAALVQAREPVGLVVVLLGMGELLGFWFIGLCLAGLLTFGELLVQSVRVQVTTEVVDAARLTGTAPHHLPSPQEAARTYGGRTRVKSNK